MTPHERLQSRISWLKENKDKWEYPEKALGRLMREAGLYSRNTRLGDLHPHRMVGWLKAGKFGGVQ